MVGTAVYQVGCATSNQGKKRNAFSPGVQTTDPPTAMDDNTAATNLTAAESNIRDLNVGAATTEFTKLQVLVQVGTSVLAQSNANAQSVLTLFR